MPSSIFVVRLWIFLVCGTVGLAIEGYFEKDHGMDTVFPPVITKQVIEDIPVGHLRSLGHQRPADGPIEEIHKPITAEEFFKDFASRMNPVVVRKSVDKESPIMSSWSDEMLLNKYGTVEVWAIHRREKIDAKPNKMRLSDFLDSYKFKDVYMATMLPEELMTDIMLPRFAQCGPVSRSLVEVELWMAYGGTGSLLHYHGDHQIHCLVDGRKDFILIENQYKQELKVIEKHPFLGEGYSTLDTEMINMYKEKQVARVSWIYSSLLKGDCIFIPAGYLHQVRSYGRSLSYTIQFAATADVNLADCKKSKSAGQTLDNFDFIWTEREGHEQLMNTKLLAKNLRNILIVLLRGEKVLPYERFEYLYNTAVQKTKKKMPMAHTVYVNLDPKGQGFLSDKDIAKLSEDKLEKVVRILNSVHVERHDEL